VPAITTPPGAASCDRARRDVHPVAIEIAVGLVGHVTQVDADPEADALGLGHVRLAFGHAPLDQHGTARRVDDARELGQQAVAHGLDDAALVLGDQRLDELGAERLEAG
jgi:hypothetical protein